MNGLRAWIGTVLAVATGAPAAGGAAAQAPDAPAPKPAAAKPPASKPAKVALPADPAALNDIVRAEQQWAESLASGDTDDVDRILAPDFLGVAPDGTLYGKAQAIAETRTSPGLFLSNHANAMKVRFYGDTAIAQGSETWQRRSGPPPLHGRFVWTDTWIRRHGQWQVVAAEDLIAPDTAN
jgi:hypothetical protein